jgi:hypothetical protein
MKQGGSMNYTVRELEEMTKAELRVIAQSFGISFKVKEVKDNMISAIIKAQKDQAQSNLKEEVKPANDSKITNLNTTFHSKNDAGYNEAMITVSSGASSGNYPVVGKKVCEVAAFFTEVLNIAPSSKAIVNGREVSEDYILGQYDNLEFIMPSGSQG